MLALIIILLVIAFLALAAIVGGAIWMTFIFRARRLNDKKLQAAHEEKFKLQNTSEDKKL